MNTMNTQPQTETVRPSVAPEHTTFPPFSSSRNEGNVWVSGFDFARRGEDLSALSALVGAS